MRNSTYITFRYYFTLCTYKKTHLFLFLMNVFWGVDSKSAIHFFRPALENPDNLEKNNFSRLSRFSGVGLKKWTSAFVLEGQKTLLIPWITGKLPLIRKTTVANPKYHQLFFMLILPGYVRFGQVRNNDWLG